MSFHNSSSENDSDVSGTFDTAKSSFRVSVCLRRYFEDVRARAYFLVRPTRRVRWLQKRIQKAFLLPDGFCLCAAGHLLPPAEPLRLLGPGDRVEVLPLQEAFAEHRSGRGTVRQSEAAAARPEEETITSTLLPANGAVATYSAATQNHSNRTDNNDQSEDRNSEYPRIDPCQFWDIQTESPSAVTGPSADAVDSASGPAQWAAAAEGDSCDETSLLGVKRAALALLDAHCGPRDAGTGADEGPPPSRRVRRRVRRRPRRVSQPPPSPGARPLSRDASPAVLPPPRSPAALPPPRSPAATGVAAPRDVAQNEDACARKPRMVHSLDIENT